MATLYAEICDLLKLDEKCIDISRRNLECTTLNDFPIWNIPPYQRLYSWETQNFNKFTETLDEISDLENECPIKFFGQIILHVNEEGDFDIVDGQQRLTTFMILISAMLQNKYKIAPKRRKVLEDFIYKISKEEGNIKFAHQLKNIDVIKAYVFLEEPEEGMPKKLIALYNDYKLDLNEKKYRSNLSDAFKKSKEYRADHYKPVITGFDKISKWYENIDDQQKTELINNLCEGYIKLSVMISSSFDMAYESFMTLNSEGRSLSEYDLIKSFFIGELSQEEEHRDISKLWNAKIEIDKLSTTKLLDILEILIKTQYTNLVEACDVTLKTKMDILALLKKSARGNAKLLYEIYTEYARYVDYYVKMRSGNFNATLDTTSSKYAEHNKSVEFLIKMDYVPFVPLMFDFIVATDLEKVEYLEKAINFAKYAPFIYVTLFGQKPNKLNQMMSSFLDDTCTTRAAKLDKMYEEFKQILPKTDFKKQMVYDLELKKRHNDTSKDILLLMEESITSNDKYIHQLEHIYPQNPDEMDWLDFEGQENLKWNIGNHVIIPNYLNVELSNYPYCEKREILIKAHKENESKLSAYFGATDFINSYINKKEDFTPEDVEARAKMYAEKLEKIFIDMNLLNKD